MTNSWLQSFAEVKPIEEKTRSVKAVYAPGKPCAKCKTNPRAIKSYCRDCHNANSRATTKKIYYRNKEMQKQAGLNDAMI